MIMKGTFSKKWARPGWKERMKGGKKKRKKKKEGKQTERETERGGRSGSGCGSGRNEENIMKSIFEREKLIKNKKL